ncbi:MAG: RagB/SusD family nutrient uptake outer membrane protein [Prolixibacteraceae bacterium]
MKSIKYILISFVLLMQSCGKDVLDFAPIDRISDLSVWNDPVMVQSYVNNLYSRIPFNNTFDYTAWDNYCDEGTGPGNGIVSGTMTKTSETNGYWDYGYIRALNVFLEQLPSSTINQSDKIRLEGEVRFIRAFVYFEMMKRYGGVPLVDVVLDPYKPIDDKYLVRATEEAIANFINTELTTVITLLPDVATPRGKINKWTAHALNARAMLWAASIAKFGTVALNGVVGIPASKANTFYAKASVSADAVINSGKYSLYNPAPSDKSENYRRIFIDEENSEVIFEKPYDGVLVAHSFDAWCAPTTWVGRGSLGDPTLEYMLGFENIDGSTTPPTFGAGQLYNDGYGPFAKKDPRLRATVFFQGETFSNGTIESYEGIDPSVTPDPSKIITSTAVSYNGKPSVGLDSRMSLDDSRTVTGFTRKKYIITTQKFIAEGASYTNLLVIRLAEMYLTKAEAEFQMGNINPAVTALNMTRSRAGISLVDATSITMDKIMTERRSELSGEAHRMWDLRRWRTALSVMNYQSQGLRIIYHFASGKYYFLPFNSETSVRVFKPEHYYNPITDSRINNNSKLVENPFY